MKKALIIGGAILLAALLSAGSFYGGMAYQRNQANQVRANFFRSRGIDPNAQNNGGGQRQGFFGGGATGQVKSLQGNVLTLSTAQNTTTVNLTDTTRIEKAAPAATTDLQPGERVTVTGQRDSNGNITASQVLILDSNPPSANTAP
jgi:hypothetical protein